MLTRRDAEHPFFRPLWRRVATVAFCAAWMLWELYNGEMFWTIIVAAITAYAAWTFLIDYGRREAGRPISEREEEP